MRASFVVALGCVASASAFVTPAMPRRSGAVRMAAADDDFSTALPYDKRPPALDGTLPGDAGFDPVGFSSAPPRTWFYGGDSTSIKWYREAELVHGRTAMLAVLGWVFPSLAHFPGNDAVGADAFAKTNPLEALSSVPEAGLWQIAAAVFAIEVYRIQRVVRGDKDAGDLGLGQGGFNPFGFNYSDEEYFEKQVQEVKNGRLAMVAIMGLIWQSSITGKGIVEQLSGAFNVPEAVSKAGYYFPEGL